MTISSCQLRRLQSFSSKCSMPKSYHYPATTVELGTSQKKYKMMQLNSYDVGERNYLVGGFNPFENISQIGTFPQVGIKIKSI